MERCVAAGVNYVYELANGSPVLAPTAAGAQPLPPAQLEQQGVPVAAAMAQDMAAHTAAAADLVGAPPGPGNSVPPGAGMVPAASAPSDENYCLRWNEYEKKYAETFRVLRDDEYFTDVTLATEGHSVKAHRVILSACSNYFHAILKTMSPWQHPVLLLQDVRSSDLNSLMDFIYFGQASVSQDSLQSFLRVAEKLKIKGLCESLAPPPPPPLPVATTTSPPTPQPPPLPPSSHSTPTGLPPGVRGQPPPPPAVVPPPPVPVPVQAAAPMPVPVSNFEGLLPRTPYIPEPSVVPLSTQTSTVMSSQPPPSVVSPLNVAGRAPAGPPAVAVAPAAVPVSAPPPMAHQSPRLQSSRPSAVHPPPPPPAPRPATETLVHYAAPPKRAKYGPPPPSAAAAAAASMSPQSILQRQLQLKEGGGTVGVSHPADHVEVKSEPMSILSNPQEPEVPSSGVAASVTEFITSHDSDLALQTIGQGISPGFMFSPDPAAAAAAADGQSGVQHVGQNVVVSGANGPPAPTATLVTIDGTDGRGGATIVSAGGGGSHPGTVVTSMATLSHHQQPPQQVQQQQQQHTTTHHLVAAAHHVQQQQQQQPLQQHHPVIPQLPQTPHPRHPDEPQDLTPGPQDSPAALTHTPPAAPSTPSANNGPSSVQTTPGTPTPGGSGGGGMGSPSTPTPPKKDRNSRKTCGYCHKDFHEMSLKRHIKDVHFRSQNTYVICPQCCKQYASQNSLYSHLNRVHGVKKDMMPSASDLQLQVAQAPSPAAAAAGSAAVGSNSNDGTAPPPQASTPTGVAVPGDAAAAQGTSAGTPTGNNHHDGIMDLAQHSDSSN